MDSDQKVTNSGFWIDVLKIALGVTASAMFVLPAAMAVKSMWENAKSNTTTPPTTTGS